MVRVEIAGFFTTIQDLGRKGYSDIGVPVSGVMDYYSAKLANTILTNQETDAVLEITLGYCKLVFEIETFICITGGDFSATINNKPIALNLAIKVNKNDVLKFGKRNYGVRTYIAILGGYKTEKVLNSRSFYNNITNSIRLNKGDKLPFNNLKKRFNNTLSAVKPNKNHFKSEIIECFKGPEFDLLSRHQINQIQSTVFSISKANNRMAYQLNEPILNTLKSMLTSAVFPGTVQLTPSGTLIVLMRDCQVTGGYPRILQLDNKAINRLSQKTTNEVFKFKSL